MTTETSYALPAIPYLRLRFHLRAEHACTLPGYKGSLLRGAFGHALRRTVCVQGPKHPCETCMLRSQCVYTRLFEPYIEGEPPRFLRGLNTAPRPYVFEPVDRSAHYQPGDILTFDLLLFGTAVELMPYIVFAVSSMAETGLGRQRHRFFLQQAFWQEGTAEAPAVTEADSEQSGQEARWHPLYDGHAKKLTGTPQAQQIAPAETGSSAYSLENGCTLRFITSTRLKFRDTLTKDFTFRMLVFKMLRRVLELAHFHVPEAQINWEFHDLLVAADDVRITANNLEWNDWVRRSNRQNTSMKMGGFTGDLTLEGNLTPFIHLLRICEVVHVGKGTVFGNGKVGVVGVVQ